MLLPSTPTDEEAPGGAEALAHALKHGAGGHAGAEQDEDNGSYNMVLRETVAKFLDIWRSEKALLRQLVIEEKKREQFGSA